VSVLDLATGRERWHHYERGWQVLAAAFTGDGRIAIVVVNSATGTDALGFDAATGDQLWRHRLGSGFNCTYAGKGQIAPIGGCLGQLITGDGVLYAAGGAPNPVGAPDIVGPAHSAVALVVAEDHDSAGNLASVDGVDDRAFDQGAGFLGKSCVAQPKS